MIRHYKLQYYDNGLWHTLDVYNSDGLAIAQERLRIEYSKNNIRKYRLVEYIETIIDVRPWYEIGMYEQSR